MSELINSIRLIKMYAWEGPFLDRILSLKGEELSQLSTSGLLMSFSLTLSPSTSVIAPFILFLTMTMAGAELDVTQAFTVLSIFNALQYSISTLPTTIKNIAESHIAFKRFQRLLGRYFLTFNNILRDMINDVCLEMEEYTRPNDPQDSQGSDEIPG